MLSDGKEFLEKSTEKTSKISVKSISEQLINMSRLLCKRCGIGVGDVDGICIASAGPIDFRKGELINPTNLPFKRVPLVKPIEAGLGVSAYLLNDCTAGVIGEHEFGAGKGVDNLVYVTIGTGIGGGVYVDGHVLYGKDGNAAEIGHITIDHLGSLRCGCGKRGHWEAYCSGINIPNFVRWRLKTLGAKAGRSSLYKLAGKDLSNLRAETLFKAARAEDRLSLQLVEELGKLNAIGFANVVNAYDPSLITVGGSVALENERLVIDPIKKHLREHACNRLPEVILTPLGADVGLYGAVAAFSKSFLPRFLKKT